MSACIVLQLLSECDSGETPCIRSVQVPLHPRTTILLTPSVHDSQHDGGDPRDLAAGGSEDDLNLFEEDRDGLGEGVGEADGDEGSRHDSPAPAALWRSVTHRSTNGRRHGYSG